LSQLKIGATYYHLVRIAELVKDKKLEGVKDVRDESNKEGIRIVIETKRDVSPEILLNQLYALTDLQSTIHFNMVALVNEGRQPKLLNLKDILMEFLGHRDQVVIRRTNFELRQAEAELHILEGLKIALDHIDEVITLIRSSFDKTEAAAKLQARFALSAKQAEAILQMRLQTLTNLDKTRIEEQRQKTIALIERLKNILYDPEVKKALIKQEFLDMLQKFDTSRRTEIVEYDASSYNKEDLVENVPMLLQFTQAQYIKALPLDTFKQQGRGGRGVSSFSPREEDWVRKSLVCQAHDYMLAFTNTGRVFKIRVFDLPSGSRTSRGQSLVNYLNLQPDEKITTVFTIAKELEANSQGALIFATKKGKVKKTWLHEFKNVRSTGKVAITLEPEDVLIDVVLSQSESDKIILSANNGKTVIFPVSQLSALGRTAQGVIGMRLKSDEEVISLQISDFAFKESDPEEEPETLLEVVESKKAKTFPSLLVITENGFGKQTDLAEFRQTNRGASGVKTLKLTEKTGRPVAVQILHGHETSLIVTTKNGVTIRLDPNEINQFGRVTQGVKLIKLDDSDRVVTASVI
jgi:DNA gyrase subunit A